MARAHPATGTRKHAKSYGHGIRRQQISRLLLNDIIRGHFAAGERLIIHDLAKRYQVSPTPIREALVALQSLGIVSIQPNRGAEVRQITSEDLRHIGQVRSALECTAVRLACGATDLDSLQELRQSFNRLLKAKRPTAALIERAKLLDDRLHTLIRHACGNRYLALELERFEILFRSVRDVAWEGRQKAGDFLRVRSEAKEHLAIVDAILANDAKLASKAMLVHIRSGVRYCRRGLPSSTTPKHNQTISIL